MNLKELATQHDEICESLFHTIVNDNNHRPDKLLSVRDGPLEKLWGGRGIFEPQEFFFADKFLA